MNSEAYVDSHVILLWLKKTGLIRALGWKELTPPVDLFNYSYIVKGNDTFSYPAAYVGKKQRNATGVVLYSLQANVIQLVDMSTAP